MATIETSELRKGIKLIHNTQPYVVVEFQHVKPGKGNAFIRTKIKNLITGAVLEHTYRSGVQIEAADVEDKTMTFLYNDGDGYHFMDAKTYDQVAITDDLMGDAKNYILPDMSCAVVFWQGRAITVDIPQHVELKVAETEPGVRGDTATNVTKPAKLETGAELAVPLFIAVGDTVKVDTTSGKYIERTARA